MYKAHWYLIIFLFFPDRVTKGIRVYGSPAHFLHVHPKSFKRVGLLVSLGFQVLKSHAKHVQQIFAI